ncbi:hypothetical protein D3C87_75410 [compost metagenome]
MKTPTSVLIIEEIFDRYVTYKQLENKLENIRDAFKEKMMEDEVRRIFPLQGIVAKYTKNRIYEVNQIGINELLNDHGLLINTARFDKDERLSGFENEQTYHLRINTKIAKEEYDFSNLSEMELTKIWVETHSQLKALEPIINGAKKQIALCKELVKTKKLSFSEGTISLAKNKVSYNVQAIANTLGIDFVIENAKVSSEKLTEYVDSGFISSKEISKFKKLVNVTLKFVVMTLDDENLILNILKEKRMNASLRRGMEA